MHFLRTREHLSAFRHKSSLLYRGVRSALHQTGDVITSEFCLKKLLNCKGGSLTFGCLVSTRLEPRNKCCDSVGVGSRFEASLCSTKRMNDGNLHAHLPFYSDQLTSAFWWRNVPLVAAVVWLDERGWYVTNERKTKTKIKRKNDFFKSHTDIHLSLRGACIKSLICYF